MKNYLQTLDNKKKVTAIVVAVALLLCLIGAGVAIAKTKGSSNSNVTSDTVATTPTTAVTDKTSVDASVTFDLEGFDWSVPVLLSVTDSKGNTTYVAYTTPDNAKLTLETGTYTVAGISPITGEGGIYITSEPVSVDKTTEVVAITGVRLEASDVTDEQINAIVDTYNKAKDAGVVTSEVVTSVNDRANAGAEARASKSNEEKAQATENAKNEAESKHEQSSGSGNNSGASNGGSSNGGSNNNSNSNNTATHTHSWTPVYRTVHHDAVTHEEPVYETVKTSTAYCTKHQVPLYEGYKREGWLGFCPADPNCLANSTNIYETKQVQTGTKTVTDKAAYDEQVIDHYTCSCGATK